MERHVRHKNGIFVFLFLMPAFLILKVLSITFHLKTLVQYVIALKKAATFLLNLLYLAYGRTLTICPLKTQLAKHQ